MLAVLSLGEFILTIMLFAGSYDSIVDPEIDVADFLAPLIKMATYSWSLKLLIMVKNAGLRRSSVQFFFWLTLILCQGFTFGSAVNHTKLEGLTWIDQSDNIIIVSYAAIAMIFFLNFFTHGVPSVIDPRGTVVVYFFVLQVNKLLS